jgi:hypothetical protein
MDADYLTVKLSGIGVHAERRDRFMPNLLPLQSRSARHEAAIHRGSHIRIACSCSSRKSTIRGG